MGFLLRREEVLNVEQLQSMLDDSPVRAAQAILVAAKEGLVDAQALLGQILLDGQGIERDPVLARRWFQIAANAGHLMARNMLGRCWEHGWGGPSDLTLASLEYRQAAEAGLDWAMYNYANLLATGRGGNVSVPTGACQGHFRTTAIPVRAAITMLAMTSILIIRGCLSGSLPHPGPDGRGKAIASQRRRRSVPARRRC